MKPMKATFKHMMSNRPETELRILLNRMQDETAVFTAADKERCRAIYNDGLVHMAQEVNQ